MRQDTFLTFIYFFKIFFSLCGPFLKSLFNFFFFYNIASVLCFAFLAARHGGS